VPPSAYEPDALVSALDVDGVWGAVIQPTQGFGWFKVEDLDLLTELCRASNDWIAEFCAAHPDRLKGVAVVNVRDPQAAVLEFQRCADRGIAAAFVPVWPAGQERYDHPKFEPVFAAANDTGIPLLMHVGSKGPDIPGMSRHLPFNGEPANFVAADRTVLDYWVRHSMASIIFAGTVDRFPNARIGTVEHELAWIPHCLSQMDCTYRERPAMHKDWTSADGMLPGDYWRRNMFATFMEDAVGVRLRDVIGVDNIAWGNDFPPRVPWPRSMQFLDHIFADVSPDDRRAMTCDYAARLYGFVVSNAAVPGARPPTTSRTRERGER
jgi:hypothetical protein